MLKKNSKILNLRNKLFIIPIIFLGLMIISLVSAHHFGYDYLIHDESIYGDIYIYESNSTTVEFTEEDAYVIVWENQNLGFSKGMRYNNGTFIIQRSGKYQINGISSFSGQTDSTHGFTLGINGIKTEKCYTQQKLSSADPISIGYSCLLDFKQGETISMMVSDEDATLNDILIITSNLNLEKIQ